MLAFERILLIIIVIGFLSLTYWTMWNIIDTAFMQIEIQTITNDALKGVPAHVLNDGHELFK